MVLLWALISMRDMQSYHLMMGISDTHFCHAVVINMEHDIAAYTVMAIGDERVINKQLHIRPPLNTLSQHDLIYIYEDKVFRQLCIGNRLIRSPVTESELDTQISGMPASAA